MLKALRAWLRLLPEADEQASALDERLNRAAKALAPDRDRVVMAATAQWLARRSQKRTARKAAGHITRATTATAPHGTAGLVTAQSEAVSAIHDTLDLLRQRAPSTAVIETALQRSYARARKRLREGLAASNAERLHTARRFVIRLRYQLAILAGDRKRRRTIEALEKLRSGLGRHHDIHVLLEHLDASNVVPDRQAKTLSRLGRRRQKDVERRIARRAKRLFARKPAAFTRRLALGDARSLSA
jgi:CHAD domain-containing protein